MRGQEKLDKGGFFNDERECICRNDGRSLNSLRQKIENYENTTYGTLCTWEKLLDYTDALELL